ncbi:DUF3237 domain-containing protein [Leucobacter allii]|uniref:DUF3237 domain-containing protein n=1 Tax=Leucobacter allii TaxID=2932247 RepID=UPI001FD07256|nr:DUF3237 domain-containing protein [Leucobacter allii]UOR02766.1 DUF3237 domain-containing protein [Leucobacter allii]
MTLPVPSLAHVFDVEVALGALEDHGATRAGHRRVIPIVGGRITGALEAEILPGGADWQIVRSDGSIEIDGRYSARTTAGELLYLQANGVRSGEPAVLEALLRGEAVDPADYYFRTVVTIETSAERLATYQRALFLAVAERGADVVRYATYRFA